MARAQESPSPLLDPFHDSQRFSPAPASSTSDDSSHSRWSFLDTPSPDLTLSMDGAHSGSRAPSIVLAGPQVRQVSVEGDAASEGHAGQMAEMQGRRAASGLSGHASRLGDPAPVERLSGLLAPVDPLHLSTGSAPDSFIDPYMASPPAPEQSGLSSRTEKQLHPPPPSRLTTSPSHLDLLGRPLPLAPPPADPYAQALADGTVVSQAARHRLSSARSLALPFNRFLEDDTQSSIGSAISSTTGYWDRSLNLTESTSAPQLDTHLEKPMPRRPTLRGLASAFQRRSYTEGDLGSPRLSQESVRRPLSAHVVVDLPTPPLQSYSPKDPVRRHSQQPVPPVEKSAPRPTLAVRRSQQDLPPLLPVSLSPSMPYPGSTPSLVSSASPAPLSAISLQCLTRSDDGFYRLPLTPSVHSARRGARSREATSDLSFPLPPLPDSAALLLDRAAAAQTAGGGSSYRSSGGATPSPTYSLPSSPPPSSAPPNLPDFVSVFVNPATSGERTESVSRDTYPPVPPSPRPIPSHVRQLDSISSSVLSPPRASQHLRQRVLPSFDTRPPRVEHHEPIEGPDVDEGSETASIVAKKRRTEAWLSALPSAPRPPDVSSERATLSAGSLRSGLGWLGRVGPGWAIRSEGRDWTGEKLSDSSDSGHGGPARSVASRRGRWTKALSTSRKARIALAVTLVVVLLLAVGLATGLTRKVVSKAGSVDCRCENGGRARSSSDGRCFCACPDAWGGTSCHLDAACVDVGVGAARPVAQGLLDVATSASELWQPEVNTTRLATVLHNYILPTSPSSSSTTCQSQLSLLVLPSLSFSAFPSRLRWTESALLHTLAITESNSSLSQFRTFASSLSFSQFGDAPATVLSTNYQLVAGGYLFDLATLERSVRAEQTWEKVVDPPDDAVALIGPANLATLDRMSAQASAANAQRSRALEHYWVDTLALEDETLDAFRAAVKAASIVLPVEEVGGVQRGVALACRLGLNAEEAERINEVEGGIFGLAEVQAGQAGNSSCTDRPIYGMLNLLNRPLPSSANSSSPLSVTSIDQNTISSRLTYHAGALLSPISLAEAFPSSNSAPSAPATPERIGLAPKLDHVLLDYLLLLPSLDVARELVQYLTQGPAPSGPPDGREFPVLAAVRDGEWPVLEVQLWGGWVAG